MRRLFLVAAAVAPLLLTAGTEATAQSRTVIGAHGFGGAAAPGAGFQGGGAWRGGMQNWRGAPGWRGASAWQGAPAWRGVNRGFYPRGAWRGGYYRRWGGSPYWGWGAAGLAAATVGALATYPYDPYYYDYPAYPAYPVYPAYSPAYDVVPTATGGQCSTPVKMCTLYQRAPLGVGCSCRAPGGRARGTVVGP